MQPDIKHWVWGWVQCWKQPPFCCSQWLLFFFGLGRTLIFHGGDEESGSNPKLPPEGLLEPAVCLDWEMKGNEGADPKALLCSVSSARNPKAKRSKAMKRKGTSS